MKGRLLGLVALALTLVALGLQTGRLGDRMRASVALRQAELTTLATARMGARGRPLLQGNLRLLRRAAELDPQEAGIPLAAGSLHLLLDNPLAAIGAYERALALEPRPEIYLNLGRAQARAGKLEAARESFALAVQADRRLRRQVPEPLRPARD